MSSLHFRVRSVSNRKEDVEWIICVEEIFSSVLSKLVKHLAGIFLDDSDIVELTSLLAERENQGCEVDHEEHHTLDLKKETEEFLSIEDSDMQIYWDEEEHSLKTRQPEELKSEGVFCLDEPFVSQDVGDSDTEDAEFPLLEPVPEDEPTPLFPQTIANKLVCSWDSCDSTFLTSQDLKSHQLSAHPEVCCDLCETFFEDLESSLAHVCGKKCKECNRNFKSGSDLKMHMRIHKGEKPFMCDLCGNSFRQRGSLSRHKLTHTKENRFECRVCGKFLRHKHYLVKHMMVHTGQKPHSCDQCDKAFTQRSNLAKHKKKHHSLEREYICPFCKKEFIGEYYLSRHLLTHKDKEAELEFILPDVTPSLAKKCYDVRKIRCGQCPVTVKNEENLRRHISDYHSL